ncbi:MAG TPA: hypothetical protein VMX17_04850 [Candidatus Glassbacteria bacterium]|nr:hypothetical protein [Candidatus Glassbacteria bacterium]
MKKSIIVILMVLFSTMIFSQEEKKPEFRKAFFGMTQAEVKKLESDKLVHETKELLFYEDSLFGINCNVGYFFMKDKFAKGGYYFSGPRNPHSNKTDFVRDYENIKAKVVEKYGKPKADKTIWKNDLYKDDPSEWGMAVSVGHLVKYCTWERPEVVMSLEIFGDNYKINLKLDYMHPDFDKMKEAADKEKEEEKF